MTPGMNRLTGGAKRIGGAAADAGKKLGEGLKKVGGRIGDAGAKYGPRGLVKKLGDLGGIDYHGLRNPFNGKTANMRRNPNKQDAKPGFNRPDFSPNPGQYAGARAKWDLMNRVAPVLYDSKMRREKGAKPIDYNQPGGNFGKRRA